MLDHDEHDVSTRTPIGERLREAREAAGLSLDQVSARTRIRVPVLQDLEAGRLGSAATAVYTRGHLRAIASTVGMDPAPLVRDFDEQIGVVAPTAAPVDPVPAPRAPAGSVPVPRSAPPERPRWLSAALAGAAVLVGLLAVGTLSDDGPDREDALPQVRAGSTTAAAETPPPPPVPPRVALVLEARGESWLSVRDAATTLFEGLVEDGWTRRFEDRSELTVRVGNAAVVSASCGGTTAGPQGEEGEVVTLACTRQGLQRR